MIFVKILIGLLITLLVAYSVLWLWMEGPDLILFLQSLWEEILDQAEVWKALFSQEDEE